MSIFEIVMMICFGASWPASIYKSCKTHNNGGKSLLFLCLILLGYAVGIIHKVLYSRDLVMALYILNAVMVTVDLLLYLRNDREAKAAKREVAK